MTTMAASYKIRVTKIGHTITGHQQDNVMSTQITAEDFLRNEMSKTNQTCKQGTNSKN